MELNDPVIALARAAIGRGDLLAAYDLVRTDGEPALTAERAYLAVLAMARMGAVQEATRLYDAAGLARADDVDSLALGARLIKDRALSGGANKAGLAQAASAYADIFDRTKDPFPAINAATLSFLSGDSVSSASFARATLAAPAVDRPEDYYSGATRAEALVLLGRTAEAEQAMTTALTLPGANYGARSTTLRQFELLAKQMGTDEQLRPLIELLRPPAVAFYTGHIFKADSAREAELASRIDTVLEEQQIGFGYGALAAGADILIAERLLARGAEVNILLPFAERDFIAQSVLPAGTDWVARYDKVRAAAASVSFATIAEFVHDAAQFGYGATVAMGLARLRARHLGSRVTQLALWDGVPGEIAGTGHDVASWKGTGGTTSVVAAGVLNRSFPRAPSIVDPTPRNLKALLFADFPGFTRIPEMKLHVFWDRVMTAAGRLLQRHGTHIEFANSWGDAVFAVIDMVEVAAEVALEFQEVLAAVDPAELGLETLVQMRVSVHYGPVFSGHDAVAGRTNYYGCEVSRAARVEPLTPPGSVYASEPFAAILVNTAPDLFTTTYVGKLELPKGYGQFPLFSLRRSPPAS
jgi:adenylate cyclase